MSLINRMLKDLSSREPSRADVLAGTRVLQRGQTPPRRLSRFVLLLLVAGAFTAALWWIFGPKTFAVGQPRAALATNAPPPSAVAPGQPESSSADTPANAENAAPPLAGPLVAPTMAAGAAPAPAAVQAAASTEHVPAASAAEVAASEAAFAAGQAAERRGDAKRADRLYSDALIANPQLKPAREALVELRMAQNRPVDARRVLNRGFALSPDYPAFARLDEKLRAKEAGTASARASAPMAPSPAPRSEAVRQVLELGDKAEVEHQLIEMLVADERMHEAREALVEMRLDQGRLTDARRSLNIGLGVAADHAPYRSLDAKLTRLESPAADTVAAKPATPAASVPAPTTRKPVPASDLIQTVPLDLVATEAAALKMLAEGRVDAAAEMVSNAHMRAPEWPGYRRLAARIELARNRPEAVPPLLESNPPALAADPEYHGLLASAYQRLGRHAEAAQSYQRLLRLQPEQGHWWAGYAISRDALGDREGARSAYRQALQRGQLDPRVSRYITERLDALKPAAD